jgi:cytoskeletal protein CcmA (bactofilin family)
MWKKGESDEARPDGGAPPPAPSRRRESKASPDERATIGSSIVIKGDVSGEEDLLIQGQVEGTISLGKYQVVIGEVGKVKANISSRTVVIEGAVEGDLEGEEMVILRPSARVRGNIVAPRVVLEDGAIFKGSIEMSFDNDNRAQGSARPAVRATPPARQEKVAPPPAAEKEGTGKGATGNETAGSPPAP